VSSKSLVVFLFPICIFSQFSEPSGGISVSGDVRAQRSADTGHLFIDLRPLDSSGASTRVPTDSDGHFSVSNIAPGFYRLQVLAQPGSDPLYEMPVQVNAYTGPLTVELPSRPESRPISGVVSVQQLRHAPSKKAWRAFSEAEQYSHSHETTKAVEKLELAVRLDPNFQEAHVNLGAQYARQGRLQEAMTQFQASIEIGPPDAKSYSNLALIYLKLEQYPDAENFAKKALDLDPGNAPAQTILRVSLLHRN
jgi:tetratricopeptide (TPR) repeat protein